MTPEQIQLQLLQRQAQARSGAQGVASTPPMQARVDAALASQPSPERLQAAEQANAMADPSGPPVDTAQIQSQIDASREFGNTAVAMLNKAGESATGGLIGDEAAARFDQMIGRGDYQERLNLYREQEAQLDADHPGLSTVAALTGAVLGPGKVAKGINTIKGAAAVAAGTSAVEGFMEGEGGFENRLAESGKSAATGFVTGGLTSALFKGASAGTRNLFKKAEERPSIEALKGAVRSAYNDVRRSGFKFTGEDMSGLSRRMQRLSKTARWDVDTELDDGAIRVIRTLERRKDKPLTLNNLDKMRQRFWDIYRKTDEPFVLEAIGEVDNLIAKKANGNELMQTARAANARYAKAQLLENAFRKARLQTAATGSGGNILNKYRQAVTRIVTNPNEARWFNADEIAVMESFIEGDVAENTLRRIGKLAPGGNGLMTALNVYAASINPAMLAVTGLGTGAKMAADRSAMQGSERILDTLATGKIPTNVAPVASGQAAVGGATAVNELRR